MSAKMSLLLLTLASVTNAAPAQKSATIPYAPGRIEAKSEIKNLPPSNRMNKRFGAFVSVLGEPSPTLIGINGAYNITDFLRATAGIGRISASVNVGNQTSEASLTTFGGGIKAMVPGWNLTPVLGMNLSYASFSSDKDVPKKPATSYTASTQPSVDAVALEVNGLKESSLNPSILVGADWQAQSGFNAGLGVQLSLAGADTSPYLQLGWFF